MALKQWELDFVEQLKQIRAPKWSITREGKITRHQPDFGMECPASAMAMRRTGGRWVAIGDIPTIQFFLGYDLDYIMTITNTADHRLGSAHYDAELRSAMLQALDLTEIIYDE